MGAHSPSNLFVEGSFAGVAVVRESQGGRSSISFDYRIVARPAGATGARLPLTFIWRSFRHGGTTRGNV